MHMKSRLMSGAVTAVVCVVTPSVLAAPSQAVPQLPQTQA
jgi:hypothetical protein